jgi:PKHD-type hydroxylase
MFTAYSILSPEEADGMVAQLVGLPWDEGKARTARLTGTIKKNRECDATNPVARALARTVGERLLANQQAQRDWLPAKLSGVRFNRYSDGGTYHRHTDSPMMGEVRTDMASTIFLSDPDSYEGGELCIEMSGQVFSHKGKKGDCVVYPCGAPHWVNPVTKGERISGFTWLQSFIQDAKKREVLKNVQKLCLFLEGEMDPADDNNEFRKRFVDAGQIHGDLMRMWM